MCHYRYTAITAEAAGEAGDHDARRARSHVNACVPCGRLYRKLRREMRSREFQRAAAAAYLPLPATSLGHVGGFGRLAAWIEQHTPWVPHGSGGRAAEVFGGVGAVKVAAVGTAVVIAGGTLTSHIVHAVAGSHVPAHHRVPRRTAPETAVLSANAHVATIVQAANTEPTVRAESAPVKPTSRRHGKDSGQGQPPPSRSLGYLALGASSGGSSGSGSTSPSSSVSSSPARATVASVDQSARTSSSSSSSEGSPQPSQSGGGTDLGYLGR
jgi:hypothetical protein